MLLMLWANGQIQGVNCPPANGATIEKFKFTEESLTVAWPDGTGRESLPLNYSGYTLYHSQSKQFVQMPTLPENPGHSDASDGSDNFWMQ